MSVLALLDGDAAASSDLTRHLRSRTPVAALDIDAAYRAELVTAYVTASDWAEELRVLAAATRYDRDHPDEQPLLDELLGAVQGDLPEVAA